MSARIPDRAPTSASHDPVPMSPAMLFSRLSTAGTTLVALLLLTACFGGGGGGGGGGAAPPPPPASDDTWKEIAIATGALTLHPAGWDPTTADPANLVFRKVAGGSFALGSPVGSLGNLAYPGEEAPRTVTLGTYWIAAGELSRSQWRAIAGTSPWTTLNSTDSLGDANANLVAANGISLNAATTAFAAWRPAGGARIRLPSNDEWEAAARAGANGTYAWGEATDLATVRTWAVASGTTTLRGPQQSLRRQANAWGLYDISGNVAEWVSDGGSAAEGILRGGAWNSSVFELRLASRLPLDPVVNHALAGVRPVLTAP